ncbi:MAG: CHRD domain-containing protein [Janthinobacterium lividum]
MKNYLSAFLLLTGLVATTACSKKDDATPAPLALSGTLNGSQEVPAITTSATGAVTGTYDTKSMVLTYSVTFSGLAPTSGHFHMGTPTTPMGDVALSFAKNNSDQTAFVSPITGTATLTSAQATALVGNSFYANLHSVSYPGGEIRSQVTVK